MIDLYRIIEVLPKSGILRSVHREVLGTKCYPAFLEVGERGFIKFFDPIDYDWHRLHTSTIEKVTYEDDMITIVTRNTKYVLKKELEA